MRSTKFIAAALTLLAVLFSARIESAALSVQESVLRLHVVGASNSDSDQTLKLKARDAVLAYLEPKLKSCRSQREAMDAVAPILEDIAAIAAEASGQTAEAYLSREDFPLREYDGFSLPAGEYCALRINLGRAEGRNWWCVVFPPLCAALAEEDEDAFALFNDGETALISGSGRVIKFKIVELARAFLSRAG